MPKRPRKESDFNKLAASIVGQATGQQAAEPRKKNPAAVALGRLGGLKGGKARAEKLSAKRRREISIKAAQQRWSRRT